MKDVQVNKQTRKQLSNPTPTPKNSPLGPQKVEMIQKLSQNEMSEFKETQKMKVVDHNIQFH